MGIIDFFRMPESKEIKDLDDPLVPRIHREIIQKKSFLRKLYTDFYKEFKSLVCDDVVDKIIIELGSGGGFIKEVMPNVITSDMDISVPLDIKFSAHSIPFRDNSVDAFLLLNAFHHMSDPEICLKEMSRCLKRGGRIIMIEPANTAWRRFIDNNFHHEVFNTSAGWETNGSGPLSSANGALSWIIFIRDRAKFNEKFSHLVIENIRLHTYFRYILSGGLSYRQILPSFTYGVIKGIEALISPLGRYLGYFQTIEIRKR